MRNTARIHCALAGALVTGPALTSVVHAQEPGEVTISDTGVAAENLTSSGDATVYFGSMAKGTIYRAAPVVRVLRDGLTRPSGVTLVGDRALVLVDFTKGVVVPYRSGAAPRAMPMPAAAPPTRAEREILDLSREKWRWMAEKKADTLAALFHDEAVFVHMGGSWGKTQEVQIIRSGAIHYKHAEIFESSARIIGSTAIVLSRIRLDAVVGGNEVTNPFMVTEVYVRQKGAWKLASLSFTRLLTP